MQELIQTEQRRKRHEAIQRALDDGLIASDQLDEHSLLVHSNEFKHFSAERFTLIDLFDLLQPRSLEPSTERWQTTDAVRLICYENQRFDIEAGIFVMDEADDGEAQPTRHTYRFSFSRQMIAAVTYFISNGEVVIRFQLRHPPFLSRMRLANGFFPVRAASPLMIDDIRFGRPSSYELKFPPKVDAYSLRKCLSSPLHKIDPIPCLPPCAAVCHGPIQGWSQGGKRIDELFSQLSFVIRYWLHHLVVHEKIRFEEKDFHELEQLARLLSTSDINRVLTLLDSASVLPASFGLTKKLLAELKDRVIVSAAGRSSDHMASLVRHVYVTPLRIVPQRPQADSLGGNRILRQYMNQSDRFLSVSCVDENFAPIGGACSNGSNILTRRLQTVMRNGLEVGGRRFIFLAYSNSQLRAQSAWFYCQDADGTDQPLPPTVAEIRASIGDVSNIPIAAKQAARLGQAFSTTRSTVRVPNDRVKVIPDVINRSGSGACFTDGCGVISPRLATEVAKMLNDDTSTSSVDHVPSAFQIRYRGAKGVVSVCPTSLVTAVLGEADLGLRPSMVKFEGNADYCELEVCSVSTSLRCHLNRELIPVLCTRGVPPQRFVEQAERATEQLRSANTNATIIPLLRAYARHHRHLIELLEAGYSCDEPFLGAMIDGIKRRMMSDMQRRFRIPIPGALRLMGIADESKQLPAGTVFFQSRDPAIASGLPAPGSRIAIGRDPFMHPGDIRVLTLQDVPASSPLCDLFDVLVFSVDGEIPEPAKMGGGDLDGDLYIVLWQPDLMPTIDHPPMLYDVHVPNSRSLSCGSISSADTSARSPASTVMVNSNITPEHYADFWLQFAQSNILSSIANAHACWADKNPDGVRSKECLELARLASVAVDFAKTGVPAILPTQLRPRSWPHWMDHPGAQFQSTSVLGQIHSCIQSAITAASASSAHASASAVTQAITLDPSLALAELDDFEIDATHTYNAYSKEVFQLMQEFDITREADLITGCNLALHSKSREHRSMAQRQSRTVQELRWKYQRIFWRGISATSPARLKKASAWYKVAYSNALPGCAFLSFAWIAVEPMIAIQQQTAMTGVATQPDKASDSQSELESQMDDAERLYQESKFAESLTAWEMIWRKYRSTCSHRVLARIILGLANAHYTLREYHTTIRWCEQALKLSCDEIRARVQVLLRRANATAMPEGENEPATSHYRETIDLAFKLVNEAIEGRSTRLPQHNHVLLKHLQAIALTRKLRHLDAVLVIPSPDQLAEAWASVKERWMSSDELVVLRLGPGEYDFDSVSCGQFWRCDLIIIGGEGVSLRANITHAIQVLSGTTTIWNVSFVARNKPNYAAVLCSTEMVRDFRTYESVADKLDNPRVMLVDCEVNGKKYHHGGVLLTGIGAEAVILNSRFLTYLAKPWKFARAECCC